MYKYFVTLYLYLGCHKNLIVGSRSQSFSLCRALPPRTRSSSPGSDKATLNKASENSLLEVFLDRIASDRALDQWAAVKNELFHQKARLSAQLRPGCLRLIINFPRLYKELTCCPSYLRIAETPPSRPGLIKGQTQSDGL